jgi:hypothetical protein
MMRCVVCSREVMFVADPYDLPEGVGMAVEEGGVVYCSRCFVERRERGGGRQERQEQQREQQKPKSTCRVCGRELARGEVGMCASCFYEHERASFPACGVCGALLPRTRGWREPLAPRVRGEANNYHWWHERTQVHFLCLACAERYAPEDGWLWTWEKGELWLLWAPWEPEQKRKEAKETSLQLLQRRIAEFGELPPQR